MILRPISFSKRQPCKRLLLPGIALLCSIWATVFMTAFSAAEEQHTAGSSAKSLRKQTVSSLPLGELNPQTRDKINSVVQKPSVYRRLPVTSITADPDHFRFLVRYPEVVVNIWQLMGVTQMETDRTGPYTLQSNDGAGTLSSIELVYGTENLHIFYGTGTYEGPILKRKLKGRCVLVLRCENQTGPDGKSVQTSQLDVFLKIDNATAGLIAKTIQPIVGTTADHNFVESLKFIQRLDQTTRKNGPGVEHMSKRLDLDAAVQKKYAEVIDLVFERAISGSNPTAATNHGASSLQSRRQPAPARAFESGKLSNPNYLRQTKETSYQSYPQTSPAGDYSNGADRLPRSYQPSTQVPAVPAAIQLGDRNRLRLPAHGSLAPTYASPTQSGYSSSYGYQALPSPPTGQVRRQAYSEYQSPYSQPYNATHAYQQFSGSGQSPVQATYDHYGNVSNGNHQLGR